MRYAQTGVVARGAFATTLRGLAVDREGGLYAAGDGEIKTFDAAGRAQRRWRTASAPWSVAVDDDGLVYAGEEGQIEIFDPGGRLRATWRHSKRLARVTAIGFAGDDVLAGEAASRAILRFDGDGTFINDIGTDNRMKGFLIPNGVVQFGVDQDGVIHATNPGKHRVERYTPAGELLGHFGRFDGNDPAGFGGCCNPTNVAVAGRHIYVSEKADPRAKVYDLEGRLLAVIATDVFDANCKNMAIVADARGRVYVADPIRREVLAFEPQAERPS